jgi:hypothetical protein
MTQEQIEHKQDEVPANQAQDEAEAPAAAEPAGFEEFDLDDIEVIESKVFA